MGVILRLLVLLGVILYVGIAKNLPLSVDLNCLRQYTQNPKSEKA